MNAGRPAAFLDRDGTIVRDVDHLRRPEDVELIDGAAEVIAALNRARIPVVVITNQSGIARGLFTEDDFAAVSARLNELLAATGARIDATYHCPHHPDFSGPCECRKPATRLFERAIADLGLDPRRSAFIGDRWRDVAAADRLEGRGYLVVSPSTTAEDRARLGGLGGRIRLAGSLAAAAADAFGLTALRGAR